MFSINHTTLLSTLLSLLGPFFLHAQTGLDTVAVYNAPLNIHNEGKSIWFPHDDGFILLAKSKIKEIHIVKTDASLQAEQIWTIADVPYFEDWWYLGKDIVGDSLRIVYRDLGQRNLSILTVHVETGEYALSQRTLANASHESDLYITQGDEHVGFIRYYKKGKDRQLRYYRLEHDGSLSLFSKSITDDYLSGSLKDLEFFDQILVEHGFAHDPFWNALHDVKASWKGTMLHIIVPAPIKGTTIVYSADFGNESPIGRQSVTFLKDQINKDRLDAIVTGSHLIQGAIATKEKAIHLQVTELQSGLTILCDTIQFEEGKTLFDDHVFELKANVDSLFVPVDRPGTYFRNLQRYRNFCLGAIPLENGNTLLFLGSTMDQGGLDILGSLLMTTVGGLVNTIFGFDGNALSLLRNYVVKMNWAEVELDASINQLIKFEDSPLAPYPARTFQGDRYLQFEANGDTYIGEYNGRLKQYFVFRKNK